MSRKVACLFSLQTPEWANFNNLYQWPQILLWIKAPTLLVMIEKLLFTLCAEFERYCPESRMLKHRDDLVLENAVKLLQQYPAGISKPVLLTELEYKWKLSVKCAEHAGILKQALSSLQLSPSDVIVADLTKLDEHRCTLSSEGAQCAMIMHRQWFDWTMFLSSVGVADALTSRRVALTQCRLLKLRPPVLLPTPISMFVLRLGDAVEAFVLQDVLQVLYSSLWEQFVLPCIAGASSVGDSGGTSRGAAGLLAALNRPGPLPDNSETLVVFAEVLGCGEARSYGSSADSTAQYRLVTLRLVEPAQVLGQQQHAGGGCVLAYMMLFDDQEALTRLWQPGDLVMVYRPYLRANSEEPSVFGARQSNQPAHTLSYEVQHAAHPGLLDHLPKAAVEAGKVHFVPFHLLYGSVTVLARVEAAEGTVGHRGVSGPQTILVSPGSGSGQLVRVLGCAVVATPAGADAVELWCAASAAAGSSGRLLRVRCPRLQFDALCGSGAAAALSLSIPLLIDANSSDGPSVLDCVPACRPGHLLRLTGLHLLQSTRMSTVTQAAAAGLPVAVLERVWGRGGVGGAVEVTCCSWGAAAADIAATPLFTEEDTAGPVPASAALPAAAIVNISKMAGLACSPSLVTPLTVAEALLRRDGPGAGCVLVTVPSLQPMHPSVRVCEHSSGEGGGDLGSNASVSGHKRPAPTTTDASAVLKRGYQIMRIRDGSGEALCVLESAVLLGPEGVVMRVRHHATNTSSSLAFDPCSGQMSRVLPTAAAAEGGKGQAGPGLALLLSRVDDVDCPALQHLRAQSQRSKSAAPAALPVFRIDVICDGNPAGLAAARAAAGVAVAEEGLSIST